MLKNKLTRLVFACFLCLAAAAIFRRDHCLADDQAKPFPTIVRPAPILYNMVALSVEAKIPESVPFGFICEVGGVLMTGDWKITATVTEIDKRSGTIRFQTDLFKAEGKIKDQSQPGAFAYRLPFGLKIPLGPGDPITILHDHETNAKRMEWDVHIASGDELILATTHQHDDTPPQSADRAEALFQNAPGGHLIFYWSDAKDNAKKHDTKESPVQHAPVSLKVSDKGSFREITTDAAKVTDVQLNDQPYKFVVLSSEHLSDSEPDDHSHETSLSHSLECMLLRVDPTDRQ